MKSRAAGRYREVQHPCQWAPSAALIVTHPANPADSKPLVGVWKLLSFENEFQDGSPRRSTFGEHPSGYIIFTSEGRMMAVLEAEARKAPSSDAESAALLRSMFAYTG